jgi:lambda family phage portal protein
VARKPATAKVAKRGAGRRAGQAKAAASASPYETTGVGRRSVAMRAPNYGPNSAIRYSGQALRNQSRDADRKNGYFRAMADKTVSNLIGTGIVPQPASAKARQLWTEWTDWADASGQLDFYGLQAQALRGTVVAGETFTRLRNRRPSDVPSVPLQIQVLEAEYVPLEREEQTATGFIQQGIAFDRIGRRTGYLMYRQHPADQNIFAGFDTTPVLVPASEVIHLYDAMARPGQIRGEPWFTRVLAKLKDLDEYDDAELVRKKISAMLVGFIKRNLPQGSTLEDLKEAWGEDAKIESGVGEITMEPGSLNELAPGEEVEWSNPQDVGGQYETFIRQQLRALAVFAGMLYEQLSGDYGSLNDRTWRAAFGEFKRRCEMLQHHVVVFQFCRPIWRRWCELAITAGMLTEEEAPLTVKWVPQAFPYINPVQDIEAAQAEIRAGIASRSEKAMERGRDAREIDAEQAADNASADAAGVKYDSDGRNAAKVASKPEQPGQADGSATDQGNGKDKKPK